MVAEVTRYDVGDIPADFDKTFKHPTLSKQERDRRWGKVRNGMVEQELDCLIVWGDGRMWEFNADNIRYLTQVGGNSEEAIVVFPLEGDPKAIVWNNLLAPGWEKMQNWVEVDGRAGRDVSFGEMVATEVEELGYGAGDIGLVGAFPHELHEDVANSLPEASLHNGAGAIEKARVIKSDEEMQFIKKAAHIGDEALRALVDRIEPGMTERELVGILYYELNKRGGEQPYMILLSSGSPPPCHPYRLSTDRTIDEGDIVHCEFHPCFAGYVAHKARSISLGEPDELYQRMAEVGIGALREGIEQLGPGRTVREMENMVREMLIDTEFSFREVDFHGHGLASGEYPLGTIPYKPPESMDDLPHAKPYVLEPGMVHAYNVVMATNDWSEGAPMCDDTFVITENGYELLGDLPLDFLVKDV